MGFPTNAQFTPISVNGILYADVVGDESPGSTDIVGNTSLPSFYYAYDGTNVYFRIRLREDPRNSQRTGLQNFAWGVLFNTNGVAGTYQWLLNASGLRNSVNLVQNTNQLFNSWNDPAEGTGDGTPNFSVPIVNFDVARAVPAGSSLGGGTNYFIDFFINANQLFTRLGITAASPLRLIAFTSTNNNNYNKDSLRTSEGFQFQAAASDTVSANAGDIRAKLQVKKLLSSGPSTIVAGQNATWTGSIAVQNTGKSTATTIFVSDLPGVNLLSNLQVNSVSQGTTSFNANTNSLTWNAGNLAAGAIATLTFTQTGSFIEAGNRILNTATASGVDSYSGGQIAAAPSTIPITVQATGGIAGTVIDAVTSLTVSSATVQITGPVSQTTTTNGFGDYSFRNLPPGTYTLSVTANTYEPFTTSLIVNANQVTAVNPIITPTPGSISGTVRGPVNPVQGAQIIVRNALGIVVGTTSTNVLGQYTVSGLAAGTYKVTATAAGLQTEVQGGTVLAAQDTTVDFALQPNPGSITGTVSAPGGGGIAGATVSLTTEAGIFLLSTTTEPNGTYSFQSVAPGTYRIIASAANFGTNVVGAIVASNQPITANVSLTPDDGTIVGRITSLDTGAAIVDASIRVVNSAGITVATSVTNGLGNYQIPSLPPGAYSLTFTAEGFGSQTLGAVVVSNSTTEVNVQLTRLAGLLTGTITSAETATPIPNAAITVFLNNVLIATALTDANGEYTLSGLSPGSYTVSFVANSFGATTASELQQLELPSSPMK